MSSISPDIVTDGLVVCLDAADKKSYSGSGTTWYDRSGEDNDGTLENDPTFSTAAGGCIDFDGVDDTADCGSVTPDTGDFTIALVYQLTGSGGRGGLFERKHGSPYNGFSLGQGAPSSWTFVVSGTSVFGNYLLAAWTYPTLNTWYHDVAVYSGGDTITIYRNGAFAGSDSGVSQGNLSTQGTRGNFLIANRDNLSCLPCKIGLVRVFNKALTAQQVKQNFNAMKSRFGIT